MEIQLPDMAATGRNQSASSDPMKQRWLRISLIRMLLSYLLLGTFVLPLVRAQSQLRLFHRVYQPFDDPPPTFTLRGVVHDPSSSELVRVEHSETLAEDLVELYETAEHAPEALYQVALERDGDPDETQWGISSVKLCHLPKSNSETLVLHLSPHDGKPYTLDYFIAPIPHDGSCPSLAEAPAASSPFSTSSLPFNNSAVTLRSPRSPPLLELRTPPPLTPQGEVVQPIPEKSFIQKYWIYIVIALGAMILAPAAPEEGQQGGSGQGGGGSR
ncbi:hypothetical protein JAAARDRAFT_201958 [Jaapia argillacea MUCL 33604]|uniref:ER membrane protein complex subunit 10 n=1 Tax=Jaapia argillacea MUCL 33604 TaxID=933084 RepID=A0A067QPT4_9AGAM|nr:hypothetical protein JAAARDRAFT_201958 [Jaapia argillacea MUCL 33604]